MDFLFWLILAATALVVLTITAYTTLLERKVSAYIQDRVGPNRAGPWGLLQPLADVVKLIFKEGFQPAQSYRFLQYLAPILMVTIAVAAIVMLPISPHIQFFSGSVGILYLLGLLSMSVYGITLGGWASASKYSLLGGLRSGAQMISYELAMGAALLSVLLLTAYLQSGGDFLEPRAIVEAQRKAWFVFLNPIGFFVYLVAAFAETNRAPFDLVEAEQELVGGYHTEYSAIRFGAFYVAEYLNVILSSAFIATFFWGGYLGPFEGALGVQGWPVWAQNLWGAGWLLLKTLFFVFLYIWVRWTLPRFRYDHLMRIGWKVLLPLAVGNLFILAGILLILS
jgi:NADH-quinone oxidoreductase subunit H